MIDWTQQSMILPDLISDNAVFQAGKPVRLWGYVKGSQTVLARILNEAGNEISSGKGWADENGKFELQLPACAYSPSPHTLSIEAGGEEKSISNVIFGDVWLLAGQSNMVMPVGDLETPEVIAALQHRRNESLRFFSNTLRDDASFFYGDNMAGQWVIADEESVQPISLVGYGMLKTLQEKTGRPLGGIVNAIGGTAIRAWMKGGAYYGNKVLPVAHVNISGVAWYQGESDGAPASPDYGCYYRALEEMIRDYWEIWRGDSFPFLVVQLPPSFYYGDRPGGARLFNYESIRLAQTQLLDNMPGENVYLISAMDSVPNGQERISIHVDSKVGIWQRLAEAALDAQKHEKTPAKYTGARLLEAKLQDGQATLQFRDAGTGLCTVDGKAPNGFWLKTVSGACEPVAAQIIAPDCISLSLPAEAKGGDEIHYQLELTDHYPYALEFAKDVKIFEAPNLVNGYGVPVISFRVALE